MGHAEFVERELLDLIQQAHEERHQVEYRVNAASRSLDECDQTLAGLHLALGMVREKYTLANLAPTER